MISNYLTAHTDLLRTVFIISPLIYHPHWIYCIWGIHSLLIYKSILSLNGSIYYPTLIPRWKI